MQPSRHSIQSRGRLLDLSEPIVMGILNATPDSFHAQSRTGDSMADALAMAERMVQEGASILDVGGQSTRPGSIRISAKEEIQRTQPIIEAIRRAYPNIWISIDTYYGDVAKAAADAGVDLINDVSAGSMDPTMLDVVCSLRLPYVLKHMQGNPDTMQDRPAYAHVTAEVFAFLQHHIRLLRDRGLHDILVDVGFGFGKLPEHNWTLLRELEVFQALQCPILLGVSRKKSIQLATHTTAEDALPGTIAAQMVGLLNGAHILRVHDVKPAVDCIRIFQAIQQKGARI
jgi:dihydropteroate synthase